MEWREWILHFFGKLLLYILIIIASRGFFALILWIVNFIAGYIDDAKKWREWSYRDERIRKRNIEEKEELEKRIEELENEKEGCNDILDAYIGYTGIFPREIIEKLEKKNKRKKRK